VGLRGSAFRCIGPLRPATYAQIGSIGTALYFQGAGDYITLWSPEVLLAQDAPVFRSAQAKCRAEMALAEGRRK
jgi:hypothetical protein